MRSVRTKLAANLGVALLASVVALLTAEAACRLLWTPPQPPRARPPEPAWQGLPRLEGVFDISVPNARGIFRGVLFENNSHGFRGPERSRPKPPGVFRIAVTGDSIAMGSGVLFEDTYAARLERLLNENGRGRAFEVLNVALGGANTYVAASRFERLALPFEPDLLIYGYTLNDIEGRHYRKSLEYRYVDPNAFRDSPSYLLRMFGPRWYSLIELLFSVRGTYGYELDDNYFRNEAAWKDVTSGLDRLAALARREGMCVVLFVHTRLYSLNLLHPYRRHYAQVARAAEERGFRVVQSYPYFMGEEARSFWVNPLDPHPNRVGHGRLLAALVEALDALPDSCWKPDARRGAPIGGGALTPGIPGP
jgi:hypothetical protein